MPPTETEVIALDRAVSVSLVEEADAACRALGLPGVAVACRLMIESMADPEVRPLVGMLFKGPVGMMLRAQIKG